MDFKQLQLKQKIVTHTMSDRTLAQIEKDEQLEVQQQRMQQLLDMSGENMQQFMETEQDQRDAQKRAKLAEAGLYAKPVMDLSSKEGRNQAKKIEGQKDEIIKVSQSRMSSTDMAARQLRDNIYTQAKAEDSVKNGYKILLPDDENVYEVDGIIALYEKEEKFANGQLNQDEATGTIGYMMRRLELEIATLREQGVDPAAQIKKLDELDKRLHYLSSAYLKQKQTKTVGDEDIERAKKLEALAPKAQKKLVGKRLTAESEFQQKFFANLALYSPNIVVGKIRNEMAEMSITMDEFTPEYILEHYSELSGKLEKMADWVTFFQGKELEALPVNEKVRIEAFSNIAENGLLLISAVLENYGLKRAHGSYERTQDESDALQERILELKSKLGEAIASQPSLEVGALADSLAADNMEKYRKGEEVNKKSANFRGLLLIDQSQRDAFSDFESKYSQYKDVLDSDLKKNSFTLLRKEFDEILAAQTEVINEIEAITLFEGNYHQLAKDEIEQIQKRKDLMLTEAKDQDAADEAKAAKEKQEKAEKEVVEAVAKKEGEAVAEDEKTVEKTQKEGKNHEAVRKEIEAVEKKVRTGDYFNESITSDETLKILFARVDKRKRQLASLRSRAAILTKGLALLAGAQEAAQLTTKELKVLSDIGIGTDEYKAAQTRGKEKAGKAANLEKELTQQFKEFVTNREGLGEEFYNQLPTRMRILYKFFDVNDEARTNAIAAYLTAYKNYRQAVDAGQADEAGQMVNETDNRLYEMVDNIMGYISGINLLQYQKMGKDAMDGDQAITIERNRIYASGVPQLMALAHVTGSGAIDNQRTQEIRGKYLDNGKELAYGALANLGEKQKYRRICEAYEAGELDEGMNDMLSEEEYINIAQWAGVFYYTKESDQYYARNIADTEGLIHSIEESRDRKVARLRMAQAELAQKERDLQNLQQVYISANEEYERKNVEPRDEVALELLNSVMARYMRQMETVSRQIPEMSNNVKLHEELVATDEGILAPYVSRKDKLVSERREFKESSALKPEHIYAYAKYMVANATRNTEAERKKYFKANSAAVLQLSSQINGAGAIQTAEQESMLAQNVRAVQNLPLGTTNMQALKAVYESIEQEKEQTEISMGMIRMFEGEVDQAQADELLEFNEQLKTYDYNQETTNIAIGMVGEQRIKNARGENEAAVFTKMSDVVNYQQMIGMNDQEYRTMLVELTAKTALKADATDDEKQRAVEKQKAGSFKFKNAIRDYYDRLDSKYETIIPDMAYVISHIDEFKEMYSRAMYDERLIAGFEMADDEQKEDKILVARIKYFGNLVKYLFAVLKKEMSGTLVNGIPDNLFGITDIKEALRSSLEVLNQAKA